ncbi:MAG: hypothetical protein EPN47_08180 [Acidobacteria bacterium]|nr:MAG: hypothetical protein EPN47_08180 [Acidobacteriota bacterium]
MELHGRQIFAIFEKPLDLTTKFALGLVKGNGASSHGGSQDGYYKPSPSTHSPITSNPLIPAFLLLLVGFLVLYSSPVKDWLEKTDGLPTLVQMFSFSGKKQMYALPEAGGNVGVWTRKQSGFYYCQGDTLFGNDPGEMMTQDDALTSGYRPFGGEYCANSQQMVAASDDSTFGSQQQPAQANTPIPQEGSLAQIPTKPPDISKTEADIRVWAIEEIGSYYCPGEVMFGNDPGKLMSQSDALMAGYQPSESRCTNDNSIEAPAGNLSRGSQIPVAPAVTSPPELGSLAPLSKKPLDVPKAEAVVEVWVKAQFGFYYCQNDVLFGNKPGQLMTQAAALDSGYQPSDSRCTKNKPTRAAEMFPARAFPGTR